MRFLGRPWRLRRFALLAFGLWMLGELVAGPAPYPDLLLHVAAGTLIVLLTLYMPAPGRYAMLSALIALVPVRAAFDPALALLAPHAPEVPGWGWVAAALAAVLLLSRLVALAGLGLDRIRTREPWFSDAGGVLPQPRADIWQALALGPGGRHWNPNLASLAREPGQGRFLLRFAPGARRGLGELRLRETDREEGLFQELATEPDPRFCEGLAPVLSILLEDRDGGTRVTLGAEFHRAPILRLARFWLDDPLGAYLAAFRRAPLRPARSARAALAKRLVA
jgi:hypothetical protein